MASMAPSAGGQYHWISEFAPRKAEKLLSFFIGWLTVLGWQVGLASVCYAVTLQIQGLVVLTNPEFAFQGWHASLMTIAVALCAVFFNTVLVEALPTLEFVMLVLHFAAYFVFIFVLGFMGPSSTSAEVWNSWENENGWSNTGTAVLVGIIAPITTLTSADSVCHLAEELKDASRWLPRVMVAAAASNFAIGFALLVLILYRAGDIDAAVNSPTGQPYIEILLNATQSRKGTAVLVAYIVLALIFCATNVVTTSSRQLFSFARDHGVPFSHQLSQVSEGTHVPVRAIAATISVTIVLSLILIGSSLAFNIIATLFGVALLGSYLTSISTLVYQRFSGNPLPTTRFSLGMFGLPINLATIVFDLFAFVMVCAASSSFDTTLINSQLFFPAAPNPTTASMNWAVLIFGAVVIFALTFYFIRTKHIYRSPAQITRPEEEIEMSPSPSREDEKL
ncbi:hypothetical protein LTR56_008539 [Elasticomyces elasticus]|nr:hypothetical protein LTR56_008539 [Elasticomyces elasticus]KAK3653330.1 hypothetical protein LTR22_011290 [Elasticomyces elasticus]KAK4918224.1 hypothetical protein LTR49_013923 [Elasticomyces elasticus]KAK5758389.1 hypothetical protein LTS12_011562 [Elasticomyces elasticus]